MDVKLADPINPTSLSSTESTTKDVIFALNERILNLQAEIDTLKGVVFEREKERDTVLETHKQTMVTIIEACKFPRDHE